MDMRTLWFLVRNPHALKTLWISDFSIADHFLSTIKMDSDQLKIKIADTCLLTQRDLAQKVATTIGSRVYLFSPTCYFSTEPFDTVLYDSIRTVRKDGRTALLSAAAQANVRDCTTFRSLIPQTKISQDDFGVYINP